MSPRYAILDLHVPRHPEVLDVCRRMSSSHRDEISSRELCRQLLGAHWYPIIPHQHTHNKRETFLMLFFVCVGIFIKRLSLNV